MKKLSKLVALATSLIVAALVGCSDISDEGVASGGYTNAKSSLVQKSLTLNVTSDSDLIDWSTATVDSNSARATFTPSSLDGSALKFYLIAKSLVNPSAAEIIQEVIFAGKATGTTADGSTIYIKDRRHCLCRA